MKFRNRTTRTPTRRFVSVGAALAIVVVAAGTLAGSTLAGSGVVARGATAAPTIPTLRIGIRTAISTLDFARSNNSGPVQIVEALGVEPLVRIAPDGSIKPYLAESVKHPSALRYIYTIRKGVKFWDGNELTATDVANALNYYRFPALTTSGQYGYPSVRNITATDTYTVVVNLKRRDPTWPVTPALLGWIFEKKFQDTHGADMGKPGVLIMGTGPWEFNSLDPTSGVELSANPHYWGGKVTVQHLSIKFISDSTSMALAFRAGDIDLADVTDPAGFTATSGARVTTVAGTGTIYFGMNTQVAPWNDVHVRRAAAYAINRADLVAAGGGPSFGKPVSTLIHPLLLQTVGSKADVNSLLQSINLYPFDLAKAKAELAQSAYPNGFTSHLDIFGINPYPQVCQAVAADLAKIGINLQINVVPTLSWLAEANGPHNQLPTLLTGTSPGLDPAGEVQIVASSKNAVTGKTNRMDYVNPTLDKLLLAARAESNPSKRLEDYGKMLKILARDMPYDPLYAVNSAIALSPAYSYTAKLNPYSGLYGRDFLLGVKPK